MDTSQKIKSKKKRFAATSLGLGEQLVDWMLGKGAFGVLLLCLICVVAISVLIWFVMFSDFSASADFVYNQF